MNPADKLKKKQLVTELKQVLKNEVRMDENLLKENKEILEKVIGYVLEQMQKDSLFKLLYQKPYYTGSSYEGLRIKEPTEFDIDLVLRLPFRKEDRLVECGMHAPSYVKFKLKKSVSDLLSNHPQWQAFKQLERWFDKCLYLETKKVIQWMQGLIDRSLPGGSFSAIPGMTNFAIKKSSSGPARTLQIINTVKDQLIDVDLVPVIIFTWPEWPPGIKRDKLSGIAELDRFWLIVPKPFKKGNTPVEPKDCEVDRLWRLHFPEVEKKLMHNRQSLKPAIKLMKLLRDKERWICLASYHLKTIGLWKVHEHKDEAYWREDNLGNCLIEFLKELERCAGKLEIRYFFAPTFNMLRLANSEACRNIERRLHKIIAELEIDPVNGVKNFKS